MFVNKKNSRFVNTSLHYIFIIREAKHCRAVGRNDIKPKDIKRSKVEKILKGSLNSIPSPSLKIQIMVRESLLEAKHC